jgi:hypothetical protein
MILILILLAQGDAREEYAVRAAKLQDSDADGHYKLGLWCEEKKLDDCAARAKLGHRKIDGLWVTRAMLDAVAKGIRFPGEDETKKMRARGAYYGKVLDLFWDRDRWAASLARIDELTGLFDGTLDIEVRFGDLGEVPAMGEGVGGKGIIVLDMKNLATYEKSIDDFLKRAAGGGVVAVPPAKTPAIITHELAHCFQGQSQPAWYLEGMATWCAGDGHFIYYFRYQKQRVQDIEAKIEHEYLYARGWAFFEHLEAKYGRAKTREFVKLTIREKKDADMAAEAVTGKTWATFKKEERDWSAKWISLFKSK